MNNEDKEERMIKPPYVRNRGKGYLDQIVKKDPVFETVTQVVINAEAGAMVVQMEKDGWEMVSGSGNHGWRHIKFRRPKK